MKDLKTLQKLASNPFYHLTEEEKTALKALQRRQAPAPKLKGADEASTSTDGRGAAVKANGSLNKHPTDPKQEQ